MPRLTTTPTENEQPPGLLTLPRPLAEFVRASAGDGLNTGSAF